MDAIRRSNHTKSDCDRRSKANALSCIPGICVSERNLDLREGMTAELQYRPSENRSLPPHHRANPRTHRGANRQSRVYAQFAHPSHRLHQKLVCLQAGNVAALLLVETPPVSLVSVNSNDRFLAPGALATVQQHCTGSAAFCLHSLLLNANHYFGGQL